MSRQRDRLTTHTVKRLAQSDGAHHDGGGLYLIVGRGACGWAFRYTLDGKAHTMGLGRYPDRTLADARVKAAECRKLLLDRLDPLAHRERAHAQRRTDAGAKPITFDVCAKQYLDDHAAAWKNAKHRWQWSNSLERFASPVIGKMPVADVDTAAVRSVLAPIWSKTPTTASKLRGRIEAILDWAKAMKYRAGDNPAAWKGNLKSLFPSRASVAKVVHHPALPYAELPAFMAELRPRESVGACALEFTILTAARTGETLGARWAEIDLGVRMWIVPAERMKMGREHRVPLCPRTLAILAEMRLLGHKSEALIFPGRGGKSLSKMTMKNTLQRMGRGTVSVHGFRSSFRDWCAEQTDHPAEVAEMALAHAVSNAVEAAYRRGDMFEKRRRLADDWCAYCGPAFTATGDPKVA